MYSLIFSGHFELEYPNEFLAELDGLMKKHNCDWFGHPVLQNLGNYVDFQKVENVSENLNSEPNDDRNNLQT